MEKFCDDIERAMTDSDSEYKIITREFTAKIGTKTKEDLKSMGALELGERNERGDRLIESAEEHKLVIASPKTNTRLGSHKIEKQETRQIFLEA